MSPTPKRKSGQQLDEMELWRSVIDSWKRVQRAAEKNLVKAGLSVAEFRVLKTLRDEGSTPMVKLSAETLVSAPTMTGLVDRLEEMGLVERVRSQVDRREVLIAITSKGTVALRKGEEVHKQLVDKSLSVMTREETVVMVGLLKKLADASEAASHNQA